jgi:hypothetical protein
MLPLLLPAVQLALVGTAALLLDANSASRLLPLLPAPRLFASPQPASAPHQELLLPAAGPLD